MRLKTDHPTLLYPRLFGEGKLNHPGEIYRARPLSAAFRRASNASSRCLLDARMPSSPGSSFARICAKSAVQPAPSWNTSMVFLAEAGCLVAVTLLIGFFLAYPTRSRRLPLCLAAATAVIVGVLGPLSGGATNPARQIAQCPDFYAASSILLIALVGRILFDVAMTALGVEILPARNSFVHLGLWI